MNVQDKDEIPSGDIEWAGFDSRYFLMAALPKQGRWTEIKLGLISDVSGVQGSTQGETDLEKMLVELHLVYPPRDLAPRGTQDYALDLFVGPKDIGLLEGVSKGLERSIDLGDWLGWIARPILYFLRWLHTFIPNYGVAIILLTVVVRLAMFPLAHMQAKSMRRMQDHKGELDALKEKYKDQKEVYSKELMAYMRKHKINPMGGCLLLLPQMPVFFALYRVLYNSIELRHAPFMLWIQDLSDYDPYFVTPVLLGIAMFLQQKMTPTPTADPMQAKMMKIMPVMFAGFMLFLPSGLTLYILISTIWGIAQQYWVGHARHAPEEIE